VTTSDSERRMGRALAKRKQYIYACGHCGELIAPNQPISIFEVHAKEARGIPCPSCGELLRNPKEKIEFVEKIEEVVGRLMVWREESV